MAGASSSSAAARTAARQAAQPSPRELRRLAGRFARGDFAGLLTAAESLLDRFPDDATARRAQAAALLQLGRPAEAARALHAADAPGARSAEAASLLGLARLRCGQLAQARHALDRALAIDRRHAPAWANLGALRASQGDRGGAARAFRRALALDPGLADARCDHARLLLEAGRKRQARELLQAGAAGAPAELQLLLVRVCAELGDRQGELRAAVAAVAAAPRSGAARLALGSALMQIRRYDAAAAAFRAARRRMPSEPDAVLRLAEALRRQQRPAAALSLLASALRRWPDAAPLHQMRARLLLDRRNPEAALAAARTAVAEAPAQASPRFTLASVLGRLGQVEEGLAACDAGLALDPRDPAGWNTKGALYAQHGRLSAAVRCYRRGIACRPDHPQCLFGLGLVALTLGDWASGWPLYEWRWLGSNFDIGLARPELPGGRWWAGGALDGRRLLVMGEQGHGDTLQFSRLLALLPRPAAVRLAVGQPLLRLMRQSLGTMPFPVEVVDRSAMPAAEGDDFITLMSIPARVGLTQDGLPPFAPWLRADPSEVRAWCTRLGEPQRPRVGFVWRGNPELAGDRWRSIVLDEWRPLLERGGVEWISLQKLEGPREHERRILARHGIADFSDGLRDFADTAALIETLDLVIAVDTSVAHLAGALGKPVWLLNRANSEWRWGWKQTGSAWYPSMRIFNQAKLGEWTPVLARVARELGRWMRTAAAGSSPPRRAGLSRRSAAARR